MIITNVHVFMKCSKCRNLTIQSTARTHSGGPTLQEFIGTHLSHPMPFKTLEEMMDECICCSCGYPLKDSTLMFDKQPGLNNIRVSMGRTSPDDPVNIQGEDDGH